MVGLSSGCLNLESWTSRIVLSCAVYDVLPSFLVEICIRFENNSAGASGLSGLGRIFVQHIVISFASCSI